MDGDGGAGGVAGGVAGRIEQMTLGFLEQLAAAHFPTAPRQATPSAYLSLSHAIVMDRCNCAQVAIDKSRRQPLASPPWALLALR